MLVRIGVRVRVALNRILSHNPKPVMEQCTCTSRPDPRCHDLNSCTLRESSVNRTSVGSAVEVHVHCSNKIANEVLVRIGVRFSVALNRILSHNPKPVMEQCT